jgi:hypothetical protein
MSATSARPNTHPIRAMAIRGMCQVDRGRIIPVCHTSLSLSLSTGNTDRSFAFFFLFEGYASFDPAAAGPTVRAPDIPVPPSIDPYIPHGAHSSAAAAGPVPPPGIQRAPSSSLGLGGGYTHIQHTSSMRNIPNGRPGSTIPDPNLLRAHNPMLSGHAGMGTAMGQMPPSGMHKGREVEM